MAILYFLAEEPVRNDEQQDCCLIVEVHAPDWINDELVRLAAEEAFEQEFGVNSRHSRNTSNTVLDSRLNGLTT
jgi:hypothetical protein